MMAKTKEGLSPGSTYPTKRKKVKYEDYPTLMKGKKVRKIASEAEGAFGDDAVAKRNSKIEADISKMIKKKK